MLKLCCSLPRARTRMYCNQTQAPKRWQDQKEALANSVTHHCDSPNDLQLLHARVIASGLGCNLYISSLLITKYFYFGDSQTARKVFDTQYQRPTKTLLWNSLIKGYLRTGWPKLALDVYHEMVRGLSNCEPDEQTFHLAITACTHMSEFELGCQVGGHARSKGLESDLLIGTALVNMYCKMGHLGTARRVFEGMGYRDVVSWNAMISGYSQSGYVYEAMNLFKDMRFVHGILPTQSTLVSVVSACGISCSLKGGEAVHAHTINIGFGNNLIVLNSLMEMYIDCERLHAAADLFNRMESKDAVSWSTMIGGYVQHEQSSDGLRLFHLMVSDTGILPTRPILLNVIHACADLGDWVEGKRIEEKYLSFDSCLGSDASVITALLYMYAKCRRMDISMNRLNRDWRVREDVIAWNAVIKACAELRLHDRVLELTLEIQRRGISPDSVTFLMLLSVISSVPFLKIVMEFHAHVIKRGFEKEKTIANSLIDIYGKSGSLGDSRKVFNGIMERDVISWTSIIKAYGWNGNAKEALNLFKLMRETEIRPNHFTFLALLSACSHAGLVEDGWELFTRMKEEYGLVPTVEHFTCMVDILCRAARLTDAHSLLTNGMPKPDNNFVPWGILLSASRFHGDMVIGVAAARHLFSLEPRNAANYLMLAGIYTSAGRKEDANDVLRLLRDKQFEKAPGCSWFEGG